MVFSFSFPYLQSVQCLTLNLFHVYPRLSDDKEFPVAGRVTAIPPFVRDLLFYSL